MGLPELIATTEAHYEAMILELATDQKKLARVKDTLAQNRMSAPLFDTKQYTQDFEQGLELAYDRYCSCPEPNHIFV